MKTIPAPILTAATGMLSQGWPRLTAVALVEALDTYFSADPRRPSPLPESMTKAEVCQVTKLSLASVDRRLRDGSLPYRKVGPRLVRIPRAAVEALLQPATPPTEG